MILKSFLGGTYRSQIHSLKRSRTVNLIPTLDESRDDPIKAVGGFVRSPGLRALVSGLDGPVRGMHLATDPSGLAATDRATPRLFAVAGAKLYEIKSDWTAVVRGALMADTRRAHMVSNANGQVFIQNGTHGYVYTLATNILTLVVASAFEDTYGGCVYRDGYIVRALEGSNRWQFSALNNALLWEGLNARSRTNDPIIGISITGTNLWLFGSEFTEARWNSGSTTVWDTVPHGLMGVGLDAPESLASLGQVPYWLGRSDGGLMVCRAQGDAGYERISTNALETEWSSYGADVKTAWAYAYGDRGGGFYVLSFPGRSRTFVYDTRTGFWHEEGQLYTADAGYQHVEGRCHAFFNGEHLVGSRQIGAIYAIDHAANTLTGVDPIRWMRLVPAFLAEHRRVFHHRVELEMDDPGAHPVSLRYSDDNGGSYSASRAGVLDEHRAWKRLGQSRAGRLYEFSGVTDVKLTQAYLNVNYGAA